MAFSKSSTSTSKYCLFCLTSNLQELEKGSNRTGGAGESGELVLIKEEDSSIRTRWTSLSSLSSSEETSHLLQDQLKAVFILRKLLNFPEEKLTEYLQLNNGMDNPNMWFSLCTGCTKIVEEGYIVYCNIARLKNQLAEIKKNLKNRISSDPKRKRSNNRRIKKESKLIRNNLEGTVCLDIRQYILSEGQTDQACVTLEENGRHSRWSKRKATKTSSVSTVVDANVLISEDPQAHGNQEADFCDDNDDDDWQPNYNDSDEEIFTEDNNISLRETKAKKTSVKRKRKCDKQVSFTEETPTGNHLSLETKDEALEDCMENKVKLPTLRRPIIMKYLRKCHLCVATYTSRKSLNDHVNLHDSNHGKKCPHCGWLCPVDKLLYHIRYRHRSQNDSRRLATRFRKRKQTKYEYRTMFKTDTPYYCDHCSMIFTLKTHLCRHMRKYHPDVQHVQCSFCDISGFETKQLLELHCKREHPHEAINMTAQEGTIQDEEPQVCSYCSASFLSKLDKDFHVAKFHKEKLMECKLCGHTSKKFIEHSLHMKTKHENEKFLCEKCPKSFNSSYYLKCHMRMAHGVKLGEDTDIVCTECNVTFPSTSQLHKHVEHVHRKIKQLYCEHCGKAFSRNCDLKKHILLHTAPREKQYKQGPFFCEFCQAKFNVRQALYYHLKKLHSDKYSFKCEQCGTGYVTQNTLAQHKRKCKGINGAVQTTPSLPLSFTAAEGIAKELNNLLL